MTHPTWMAEPFKGPNMSPAARWGRKALRWTRLPRCITQPRRYWRGRIEGTSALNKQAVIIENLIHDEPWYTHHTTHDDGIERTDLQLALCQLTWYTRHEFVHHEDDGCLDHIDAEDERDRRLAAESAATSPNAGCREHGHDFPHPFAFRDTCIRCGCVRLMRGNPSRFTYEYPSPG